MSNPNDQPASPLDPAQTGQPAPHPEPQHDVDQREWIPVAPPHPYTAGRAHGPGGGRALAIVAMAVGLVAALTVLLAAFYWSVFVWAGAALGLIAVVLGIVAMVKRSRPAAAGITGLASGVLAILVAVAVGALTLGTQLAAVSADSAPSSDAGSSNDWTPNEQQQPLLEWPANMETGGVIFETDASAGLTPRLSDPIPPGSAPTVPFVDRAGDTADIILYVDYRCPHCMDFEAANGPLLTELVGNGAATLEVVPLSFVDRTYSPLMAGAFTCVVSEQPDAAWVTHTALFGSELREVEPTTDTLVSVIDDATGGLDAATADCIATEQFVPFVAALNVWATSNPVPNAVDESLRVTGTPLAVVNGTPYTGPPSDAAAFAQFVDEQTR